MEKNRCKNFRDYFDSYAILFINLSNHEPLPPPPWAIIKAHAN